MVMHCASCLVEYREGFTVCADCGEALREGEPPTETVRDESLQPVFETAEPSMVAVIKSVLNAAGIEHVVRGESVQGIFSSLSLGRSGTVRFYVAPEDVEDARELLSEVDSEPMHEHESEAPMGDPDDSFREVMNLEISGWDALSSNRESAREFYSSVLHDESVMIFPGGMLLEGRGAILESFDVTPWDDYEITDAKSVWLAPGALTLIYRVSALRSGDRYEALVSSTYIQSDDGWSLSVHQQTPV